MPEPWTPELRLAENGGRCRLWLGGYVWGDGCTLQEAGDDLLCKLAQLAACWYSVAGLNLTGETGPLDLRWLEFLYELGQIAASDGDLRARVLG
jgi:hypothetical protein